MTEVKTEPVKGQYLPDYEERYKELPPGAFDYYEGTKGDNRICGMIFVCPCGCGHESALDFRREDRAEFHPSWEWDGNKEAPTLSPSVHRVGHWHGWLRNGVWESC